MINITHQNPDVQEKIKAIPAFRFLIVVNNTDELYTRRPDPLMGDVVYNNFTESLYVYTDKGWIELPDEQHAEVQSFIKRFHTFDDDTSDSIINKTFTEGCCYWFAVILNKRFKKCSRIMYEPIENHFVTEISGIRTRLYDITGDVTDKYRDKVIDWEAWNDDPLAKNRIIRDCVNF